MFFFFTYLFVSWTFHQYINILFLILFALSCSISSLCLFCDKNIYIWRHDMDWFSCVSMHGLQLDLNLLLLFPIILLISFPTHCFTLGIHILVCAKLQILRSCFFFFFLKNESHSLHAIRWLGLDECSESYVNFVWDMFCHKIVKGKDC